MTHNKKSPMPSPVADAIKTDLHTPITPIKIVNHNTALKTGNANFLQSDNANFENNDDTD